MYNSFEKWKYLLDYDNIRYDQIFEIMDDWEEERSIMTKKMEKEVCKHSYFVTENEGKKVVYCHIDYNKCYPKNCDKKEA